MRFHYIFWLRRDVLELSLKVLGLKIYLGTPGPEGYHAAIGGHVAPLGRSMTLYPKTPRRQSRRSAMRCSKAVEVVGTEIGEGDGPVHYSSVVITLCRKRPIL